MGMFKGEVPVFFQIYYGPVGYR